VSENTDNSSIIFLIFASEIEYSISSLGKLDNFQIKIDLISEESGIYGAIFLDIIIIKKYLNNYIIII